MTSPAIAGGIGTGADFAKRLGMGVIGATSFGGSAREAEQEGHSYGKQLLSAVPKAGLEIATEIGPIGRISDLAGGKGGLRRKIKGSKVFT